MSATFKRFRDSLRWRLVFLFMLLAAIAWSVAGTAAYFLTLHNINEVFDTQQMQFAKYLATSDLQSMLHNESLQLPKTKQIIPHGRRGRQDSDALGFAIFDHSGQRLLTDEKHGREFMLQHEITGFSNQPLEKDNDLWRMVYVPSQDGRYIIAVGQELDYRHDLALDIIYGQFLPWLIALLLLLLSIIWLTGRELKPLRTVASELVSRKPDDDYPIDSDRVPSEARPLVGALNNLFTRIHDMLERERRFTADAAHELRTPLAALRVQTEVAQLAGDNEQIRSNALHNLTLGIDRASRLTEQLLALSRLDPMDTPPDNQAIYWPPLIKAVINDLQMLAEERDITIALEHKDSPPITEGSPVLIRLLVRNLLDNALHYTPTGGKIHITIDQTGIAIEDTGPGISPEYMTHIGTRFFRPPGQSVTGSGLGISIVNRIAALHNLSIHLDNRTEGGLCATITPK